MMQAAVLAALLALPCRAAMIDARGAAPAEVSTPFVLFSPPRLDPPRLAALQDPVFAGLRLKYPDAAVESIMAEAGTAALAAPALARARLIEAAISRVELRARGEAARLAEQAASADPKAPEFLLVVAKLGMLGGELSPFLPPGELLEVRKVHESARARLDAEQSQRLARALTRAAAALQGGRAPSLVDAVAAELPTVPAGAVTLPVLQLRAQRPAAPAPAVPPPSLGLRLKIAAVRTQWAAKSAAARGVYRRLLSLGQWAMDHAGELWRHYIARQEPDRHSFRWSVVEKLHKKGDFRGAFGHAVHDGAVEIMSPVIYPQAAADALRGQTLKVAAGLLLPGLAVPARPAIVSPMLSISGMSYPQLSAQAHLSLLYIHLKLAQAGVRQLYNTGEGSPFLLLGLLEGDRAAVKRQIVGWNLANAQFKKGSWDEAKIDVFVDRLMSERDGLFRDLSREDLEKAQIVAQFGSALNGVRSPEATIDFDRLRAIGESPFVAMTQFKLKQAAKRGAKVDPRKVDSVVAAFRDIPRDKPFKSPEVNLDFSSYENVARAVIAAKLATRKPVSLKFGVGDVRDAYRFLEYLRDAGALPDHIQIDGRGEDFSPGSGNAPPGANTSLPSREAVIVLDAILRKLGAREKVYLEATGDVLLPADAVEQLFLGADGVAGARVWMGMGLGCMMVRACDSGNCPYGIASRNDTLVGLGLEPSKVAPRGLAAALNWFKSYTQNLAEAGVTDLSVFQSARRAGSHQDAVRVKDGRRLLTLDQVYGEDYVYNLLRPVMTREEARRYTFGPRRAE